MLAPLQGKGHSRMSEVTFIDFVSGADLMKPCSDSGDISHACPQLNTMEGVKNHTYRIGVHFVVPLFITCNTY